MGREGGGESAGRVGERGRVRREVGEGRGGDGRGGEGGRGGGGRDDCYTYSNRYVQ